MPRDTAVVLLPSGTFNLPATSNIFSGTIKAHLRILTKTGCHSNFGS